MTNKSILITGSTGFIGSYLTKVIAATNPQCSLYAMSRKAPSEAAKGQADTAKFKNVHFV